MYIDLGAEKILGAEKGDRKTAIEIKSFLGASLITAFYGAIGQFIAYRTALGAIQPERILILRCRLMPTHVFSQHYWRKKWSNKRN